MKTISRNIDLKEREGLDHRISEVQKELNIKFNWVTLFVLIGVTLISIVHIYYFDKSNWSLISKFLVVIAPIGIWVQIEHYFKQKRYGSKELNDLVEIRNLGKVSVIPIDLNRIAKLEEYEDEGDLYLIETKGKKCLYLWDAEYLLFDDDEFPSDQVEVYVDDNFKFGIDKKVKCLGSKLNPIIVKGGDKWSFYKSSSFPEDLEIEERTFDTVMEEMTKESLKMAKKK